jgi:hypothetical protein
MIIDMSNGFHFRPRAADFAGGMTPRKRWIQTDFEPSFIENSDRGGPCSYLENLAVNPKRAWVDYTNDAGSSPNTENRRKCRFLANGFQRTRLMQSPATGRFQRFDSDGKTI